MCGTKKGKITSKTWFYKLPAAKATQFGGNIAMLNMITLKQVASLENLSGLFLEFEFFENLTFFKKLNFLKIRVFWNFFESLKCFWKLKFFLKNPILHHLNLPS